MFLCSNSPYPCNSNPTVYPLNWSYLCHVFTTGCLYIYYVHLPNAGCAQHLLFPFSFCHTTLLIPPSYLHPADLKQMGRPVCAVVLLKIPDKRGVFPCPCCHCACSKVKGLETIELFWRYINSFDLN